MRHSNIEKDSSKQDLAEKFNNIIRYLDDVSALNNQEFQKLANEIYPLELTLNKSYISNDHCPLLDLDVKIEQGCLNN